MNQDAPYWVLAYYLFTEIENPQHEVGNHKRFFKDRDVTGRIYISEEGINGQMSGAKADAQAYMDWMHQDPRFKDMRFKIHYSDENVFPRMTVKYREQLAAMDAKVDTKQGGVHVSPKEWSRMLEEEETLLIDVRNDYEWDIGRFKGAERPTCRTFREFPEFTRRLKEKVDPEKTKVMMYCTGGIRCELYSALMKDEGFPEVYQLDGGVIGYGEEEGKKHWEGKLFVFDDRLAVPISDEETEVLGTCHHCGEKTDHFINCANTDCNDLFLCCDTCLKEHKGCCKTECEEAPRVRPYHEQQHKPFRRLSQQQLGS